jgi:predicted anti-sigma-YlaC factor YlaD
MGRRRPRCDLVQEAVSAALDGEDPGMPRAEVEDHLEGCPACAAFARRAARLHRELRLRRAEAVPDLSAAILAGAPGGGLGDGRVAAGGTASVGTLRWLLALVGIAQVVASVPGIVFGEDGGMQVHAARHLGSFGAALGVGFLVAAWRPQRAVGILPVVAALGLLLVSTAVADVAGRNVAAAGETMHLAELVGVGLTWAVARAEAGRARVALA